MFNQNQQISVEFRPDEKKAIEAILDKFNAYDIANDVKERVKLDGDTILTAAEALILAGLLRQWYPMLARRLTYHPGIWSR